jgi:opacity protein-like surface antigen
VKKLALASLLAFALLPAASFAQVYVRVGPPVAVVEHPGPRPHPGWVWTAGYHRWDGARYVWTPGAWVAPPRPHAVWVAHRWEHRSGGWVLVEGHWR